MAEIKDNIYGYTTTEIAELLLTGDVKKYRIDQLFDWLFQKHENNLDDMSNLPKSFRTKLAETYDFSLPHIINQVESSDKSIKYLLELVDGEKIEMVLMPTDRKTTLCLSSQVGCSRNCTFCATGKLGLTRNLTTAEMIGQIVLAMKLLKPEVLTNIVFMGMGEPFDNYDNLVKTLQILADTDGLCFSPRRTTVSTSGIAPMIRQFADSGVKAKLAISLNAAIEDKRCELMPVNKLYSLQQLKSAISHYLAYNKYKVTFEYVLIKDFNMGKEDLKALIKFTGDLSCKINLIPWNRVEGLDYQSPTQEEVDEFRTAIMRVNKAVTMRQSRGDDIGAACGQLAYQNYINKG